MSNIGNPFVHTDEEVKVTVKPIELDIKTEKMLLNTLKTMEYPLPQDKINDDYTVGEFVIYYVQQHHLARRH